MAQRRNASSTGRGEGPSDLDDTRALAAKARSQTGGPVLRQNPAEISGVRPRRDSIIGARLTPPPRATSSEMPNWVWGVLGCLSVLLVGFVGLFVLARSGKLAAILGDSTPAVAALTGGAPEAAPPVAAPEPATPPIAPVVAEAAPRAAAPAEEPAHRRPPAQPSAEPAAAAVAGAAPAGTPIAGVSAVAAAAEPSKRSGSHDHTSSKRGSKEGETATGPAEPAEAAHPATSKPVTEVAKPAAAKPVAEAAKAAAAEEEDDDDSAPGQDAVEAALDALATKVRGCFVRYQIKGTARVRLVATPAGTADRNEHRTRNLE